MKNVIRFIILLALLLISYNAYGNIFGEYIMVQPTGSKLDVECIYPETAQFIGGKIMVVLTCNNDFLVFTVPDSGPSI